MNAQEWTRIRQLHDSGMPIKAIARHLSLSRNTVRRALSLDEAPEDRRRNRPSAVDHYEPLIAALLERDPRVTATEVAGEIGWPGSMTVLRQRIRVLRARDPSAIAPGAAHVGELLPAEVTSFVGRRRELAAIKHLLGTTRLLTLTGCGGIGKTRLLFKAAEQMRRAFSDGVQCVELASLRDPSLLAQTFIDQLGLAHHDGSVRSPEVVLADHFRTRHTLLAIDNCEHLVDACTRLVTELLVGAPELRVLVTSRQALGVPGEHLFVVPPLAIPTVRAGEDDDPAVTLFAERASAAVPAFQVTEANDPAVRRLCRQLDGVPLGIELAAIQLRALSVEQLADHLAERVLFLATRASGRTARHQSLDATMDWSYELCSELEQRVWARAAVFAGGFELAACERVCADGALAHGTLIEAIGGLVEKSILQREEHDGRVRFSMLEPIREYGVSRLRESPGEVHACRSRHLSWCVDLVAELAAGWFGPAQREWYGRIESERANLRRALDFAMGSPELLGDAQRLVSDAWFLWAILSLKEHRHWLEVVCDANDEPSSGRARALATLGLVCTLQGDHDAAGPVLAEAETAARAVGDDDALAYALHERGLLEFFSGDFVHSRELLLTALATYEKRGAPPDLIGSLRVHLGLLGAFDGCPEWAGTQLQRILARCEEMHEEWIAAYAESGLGMVALAEERFDDAAEHAAEALATLRHYRDAIGVSLNLDVLAWAEAALGNAERAAVMLGAASAMWQSFGEQLYGSEQWVAQRDEFATRARTQAGRTGYERASLRGSTMTREATFAFALRLPSAEPHEHVDADTGLTAREREIAELVASGLTNKQIAGRLVVSHRTVEGHVGNALRKLGFDRRSQLAAWASTLS